MRPTRKCEFCGKTFMPRSGMQKYCSEECQAEAKRLRKKRQQDLINGIEPIMDLQHQEYLTFSKAAVLMGCTRQYIYKLVANGKLKASRLSSRMAFVRKTDIEKMKGDFLAYFKKLADKKNSKWQHVYMHFHTFTQGKCTFGEINVDLCNRFREYLLTAPQGLHKKRKLHINLAANYWSTFRASIHTAYRDRKIKENPNGFLERIETIPTDKEHLSQDEVIRLASTPCSAPALKRAFLFSCLTALRKSDIKKLTWEEIQPYGSDGVMYVTTRMQKTKDIVHNPISEEALELIGYSPDKRGKVFPDFKDSMTQAPLKNWLKDAGITKHISYHCSRHSFACLQLDAGTSIAVVQRYLGHKNVATTEVYAKISDAQKRASVGCITLKK